MEQDDSAGIMETYTGDVELQFTPTILVYGSDKTDPLEYEGDYGYDDLNRKLCGYCDKHEFSLPGALPFPKIAAPKQELEGGDADPEDVRILRAIGDLALSGRFDGFQSPIQGFHGRKDNNGFGGFAA